MTINMTGILVLAGSGEFTSAMEDVDQFLLSQIDNPHVGILPTAAGAEHDVQKWIDDGQKHFTKLGAKASGIKLFNKDDANDSSILEQLKKCNFFYFSGGDPRYLLDTLSGSKAWNEILRLHQQGSILAGSSAGAMIMGKKVWADVYAFDKEKKLLPWVEGFELVPFGVMPHFDAIPKYFSKEQLEQMYANMPTDVEIIGIDEDTAYIRVDNVWKVMGKGTIHSNVKGDY